MEKPEHEFAPVWAASIAGGDTTNYATMPTRPPPQAGVGLGIDARFTIAYLVSCAYIYL